MRRSAMFATAVIAAGLLTTGCSSTEEAEQKTESANASVCLALEGLAATIEGLGTGVTGTGDVTVSKAQESINQIETAYDTVQANIQKADADAAEEALVAQQQFSESLMQVEEGLTGLDGDQSLSAVPAEVQQAVTGLQTNYEELNDSLGCASAAE